MKTVRDLKVENKRVLVRCDFNVPLDDNGDILDDFRIRKTIPTIEYLIKNGAKVILMSHLGKPEGKKVNNLKMDRVQEALMEYLNLSVTKAPDCIGREIERYIKEDIRQGEVLLLENLRFHKEEEKGDLKFAKSLSNLGDIYINDAFGASHRSHASIVGVPKYLPSAAGFLLEEEVNNLMKILRTPKKPMVAIIGGKKVETKIKPINKILEITDFLLVGGLIDEGLKSKDIIVKYPKKIIAPIDAVKDDGRELDIGPETLKLFSEKILKAETIFWNGPLGKTEEERFSKGTEMVARAITKSGAFAVVGGGETVEFLNRKGLIEKFEHVSTGGGAMLEFIGNETLPGLEALNYKK